MSGVKIAFVSRSCSLATPCLAPMSYVRPRPIFLEAPCGPVQLKPGLRPTIRQLKRAPVRGTEGPVRGIEGPVTGTGPLLIA